MVAIANPLSLLRFFLFLLAVLGLANTYATVARANHLADILKSRLERGMKGGPQSDKIILALQNFYEERSHLPVWILHTGPTKEAKAIIEVLRTSHVDGLNPDDYAAEKIASKLGNAQSEEEKAELEFMLSYAVIEYASDLRAGRLAPHRINRELFIEPKRPDPLVVLQEVASAQDPAKTLAGMTPKRREYKRLKAALAKYREVAKQGGWSRVSPSKTVGKGDRGPRIEEIRKRLEQTNDIKVATANRDVFGDALEAAIKRFQDRHGLTVDGRVGKTMVAQLNVPVERRVEQMLLNMERRRWMPDKFGEKYVFTNVADFELKVVDKTKTIFVTRVVVGKQYRHRTPVFSASMKYAVINPYWTPTTRIIREEIVPKMRRNPGYARGQNMRVFKGGAEVDPNSVDWSAVRGTGGYVFRQDGGARNALGRIKFMFPNRHSIYMHDTPSRRLFSRTVRSFSHGCIRVQEPIKFGEVLLGKERGWTVAKINKSVKGGERKIVRLRQEIPVHVTYLTAWVNKDGTVNFRHDVYGRDKILAKALSKSRRGKKG